VSGNPNVFLIDWNSFELFVGQHNIKHSFDVVVAVAIGSIAPLLGSLKWLFRTLSHHSTSPCRSASAVRVIRSNYQVASLRQRLYQEGGLRITSAKSMRKNDQRISSGRSRTSRLPNRYVATLNGEVSRVVGGKAA
jgi:hypothetical protein